MVLTNVTINSLNKDNRNFPLALTSGCFDLLHSGHIFYLNQVRALAAGAKTLVIVHGDEAVAEHKSKPGDMRPIFPAEHRALILDNIKAVDYVYVWEGWEDIVDLVRQLRPEILIGPEDSIAKSDWKNSWHSIAGQIGAELKGVARDGDDISTSNLLARIRNVS
jgi:cytidyltransferase-like protein